LKKTASKCIPTHFALCRLKRRQLAEQPAKKIRKDFSILMASTVEEIKVPAKKLREEAYYQWDSVGQAKKL